jgi:hypothetical protein
VKSDFDKQWDAAAWRTAAAMGRALIPPGTQLKRVRLLRREWRFGRLILRWWKRVV